MLMATNHLGKESDSRQTYVNDLTATTWEPHLIAANRLRFIARQAPTI
jgi:hypothetical protein